MLTNSYEKLPNSEEDWELTRMKANGRCLFNKKTGVSISTSIGRSANETEVLTHIPYPDNSEQTAICVDVERNKSGLLQKITVGGSSLHITEDVPNEYESEGFIPDSGMASFHLIPASYGVTIGKMETFCLITTSNFYCNSLMKSLEILMQDFVSKHKKGTFSGVVEVEFEDMEDDFTLSKFEEWWNIKKQHLKSLFHNLKKKTPKLRRIRKYSAKFYADEDIQNEKNFVLSQPDYLLGIQSNPEIFKNAVDLMKKQIDHACQQDYDVMKRIESTGYDFIATSQDNNPLPSDLIQFYLDSHLLRFDDDTISKPKLIKGDINL